MMEELMEILEGLRPDIDFSAENRLVDDGLLDSFDIIALVSDLGDAFDVEINASHLVPENFNSAKAMLALVSRLAADK